MTDYQNTAKTHLKGFSKAFISLMNSNSYDLIVAPANSGSAMVVFAEITAQAARLPFPRTLILPVFTNSAPQPPFDNDSLALKIKDNSTLSGGYSKILFIDDEITDGSSFYSCMSLLQKSGKLMHGASCTILAEGDGLVWDYPVEGVTSSFFPYAIRPKQQWHGVIFNLLPDYVLDELQSKVDFRLTPKEAVCLLFSLPLKDLIGSEPYLNYQMLERAEKRVPRLAFYQRRWLELATDTVTTAISEQQAKDLAKAEDSATFTLRRLLFDF